MPGRAFILDTDASHKLVGAVLSQVQDEKERVIASISKSTNKHDKFYGVKRKDCLQVFKLKNIQSLCVLTRSATEHRQCSCIMNQKSKKKNNRANSKMVGEIRYVQSYFDS